MSYSINEILRRTPENNRRYQEKILDYSTAATFMKEASEAGFQSILAQGVFDIFHIGHLDYLHASKQLGNILFVGIDTDQTVRLNKGSHRPYNLINDRLRFLAELELVDFVFPFTDVVQYGSDNLSYSKRYEGLSPCIVTASPWDPNIVKMESEVNASGNIFKVAEGPISTYSSTFIARLLELE